MIDGCLYRPFFARSTTDQIIGLDSNAQWHNEMKGVMMIGSYHKKAEKTEKVERKKEDNKENEISASDSEGDEEIG